MPISVGCPRCGGKFRAKDALADEVVSCPKCERPLKIQGERVSAYDVFVSHSSQDGEAAKAVCHALEEKGVRCWIAPRDIPPGKKWAESIVSAISDCRILVLLLSDDSVLSEQVLNEIGQATKRNLPILPIRLSEVKLTSELSYFISRNHWLDAFPQPLEPHLARIVRDARALLSDDEAKPTVDAPVVPTSRPRGRLLSRLSWLVMLSVCTGLVLIALPRVGSILGFNNPPGQVDPKGPKGEPKSAPDQEPKPTPEPEPRPSPAAELTLPRVQQGYDREVFRFAELADGKLPPGWTSQGDAFVRSGKLTTTRGQKQEQVVQTHELGLDGDFELRLDHRVDGGGELTVTLLASRGSSLAFRLYRGRAEFGGETAKTEGLAGARREAVLTRRGDTVSLKVANAPVIVVGDNDESTYASIQLSFVTGGQQSGVVEVERLIIDRQQKARSIAGASSVN